jgi:hypothetical protein
VRRGGRGRFIFFSAKRNIHGHLHVYPCSFMHHYLQNHRLPPITTPFVLPSNRYLLTLDLVLWIWSKFGVNRTLIYSLLFSPSHLACAWEKHRWQQCAYIPTWRGEFCFVFLQSWFVKLLEAKSNSNSLANQLVIHIILAKHEKLVSNSLANQLVKNRNLAKLTSPRAYMRAWIAVTIVVSL